MSFKPHYTEAALCPATTGILTAGLCSLLTAATIELPSSIQDASPLSLQVRVHPSASWTLFLPVSHLSHTKSCLHPSSCSEHLRLFQTSHPAFLTVCTLCISSVCSSPDLPSRMHEHGRVYTQNGPNTHQKHSVSRIELNAVPT